MKIHQKQISVQHDESVGFFLCVCVCVLSQPPVPTILEDMTIGKYIRYWQQRQFLIRELRPPKAERF